jgi:hypothetical protein
MIEQLRTLLREASDVFAPTPAAATALERIIARVDEPLRVAIAGKVKAGKSTLLNALVGEKLAPTDTGECTRIVTWYRDGHTYRIELHPRDGSPPIQARFHREDGAIEVDLGARDPDDISRLDVMWPSPGLRRTTLIDTPGVGSLNDRVAERSFEFLDAADDDTPADAVLYLMRHVHGADLRLLESFHDTVVSLPNPVNAIGVLSRADEIGVGRPDAMGSASRIAGRYGADPRMRRLVQVIVPVAGLLAETATTLTEAEYRMLVELAAVEVGQLDPLLLSVDRFVEARPETPLTSLERRRLLDRFGMFGIRISLSMLRGGVVSTSQELADELQARSGLVELRSLLDTLFLERSEVLKVRSALLALDRLCRQTVGTPGVERIAAEVERLIASAHPFQELSTLAAVRSGVVRHRSAERLDELERLLGGAGGAAHRRLGLDADADGAALRQAAVEALGRWQTIGEHPMSDRDLVVAARVAVRTLEGLLAA